MNDDALFLYPEEEYEIVPVEHTYGVPISKPFLGTNIFEGRKFKYITEDIKTTSSIFNTVKDNQRNTVCGVPEERIYNMKMNRAEAEAMAAIVAKNLAELDRIEDMFGKDEDYSDLDAIRFDIQYDTSDTIYSYIFMKAHGFWYSTTAIHSIVSRCDFDTMVSWVMGEHKTIVSAYKIKYPKTPFIINGEKYVR